MAEQKPELKVYQEQGAQCDTCAFSQFEGPVPTKWAKASKGDFDIMVVAERPRHNEFRAKEPLAGSTGRLVYRILHEFGYEPQHLTLTHATLCADTGYVEDKDWNKCINACSGRLAHEIALAKKPDRKLLVLLFGKKALYAATHFTQVVGKKGKRGYPIEPRDGFPTEQIVYFPMLSGDEIRGNPCYLPVWKTDLKRALAFLAGSLPLWKWPPIHTGISNTTFALLEELASGRYPVYGGDTETAGKEPLIAPHICTGLATPDWAICFPANKDHEFDFALKHVLANSKLTLVAQNINHDWIELESQGLGPICNKPWDILNAARVRLPWLEADLQSITSYLFFIDKWKQEYADDKGSDDWAVALEDQSKLEKMMLYCAKDAFGGLICKDPLEQMLEEPV